MSFDINKLRRDPLATYTEASRSRSPTILINNQSGSPQPVNKSDRNTSQDRKSLYADSSDEAEESFDPKIHESNPLQNFTMESAVPVGKPKQTSPARSQEFVAESQARPQQAEPCTSSHNQYIYGTLIALMAILMCLVVSSAFDSNSDQQVKQCKFKDLRQKKPLQSSEVWDALQSNIEMLLNKKSQSPNVFLLLHSNQSNQAQIKKLIKDIALETSKCFDEQRLIEMSRKDFETQDDDDYGYPIEQYKRKLREGNVFLIENLNDIPTKTARALHTICETIDPIEPDVVIFLTLRTSHTTDNVTPTTLAHNTLHELWKDMPDNELGALITRVIDQVLLLQS